MLRNQSPVTPGDPDGGASPSRRLIVLEGGGYRFGLFVENVREIIPAPPYTPLPGSTACVLGLANVRGRIITVIDLAARLRLPPVGPDHSIVMVQHGERMAGIAVQEAFRMVEVDTAALSAPAEALQKLAIDRAYLRGVAEHDGHLVVVVDPNEILRSLLA